MTAPTFFKHSQILFVFPRTAPQSFSLWFSAGRNPPLEAASKAIPLRSPEMDASSYQDSDVMEIASSSACLSSSKRKRKQNKVAPHEVIQLDGDDDPEVVVIMGESTSDYKNKQPLEHAMDKRQKMPAPERACQFKQKTVVEDEIDIKFKSFKQFDSVRGHSDHYFSNLHAGISKHWTKSIQHEWKVLENDLPETIFVRIYEDRMDLLRAVIIGPNGTPYHDGLFFFDVHFPPNYPQSPPLVHYHAGGLRLNPNLYACGKVCLSLLNTWTGSGCELWKPSKSTMLQVLVSIQALILNAKPYFNEPGWAPTVNTPYGEKQSLAYNEDALLKSCTTMLYSLRRPPRHFEDFVAGHFRKKGHAILVACKAYTEGAQVGCVVGEGVQDVDEGDKSCSAQFKASLKCLFGDLLKEFIAKGADCEEFRTLKMDSVAPVAPVAPSVPMNSYPFWFSSLAQSQFG